MQDYDDSYATCIETYATLRIYSKDILLADISNSLGVEPTKSHAKGELKFTTKEGVVKHYEMNNWFYSSKDLVNSRDCRRHIDFVIDNAMMNINSVEELKKQNCEMDISVFYVYSQGGPTLSTKQMTKLAERGIDIWWDLFRTEDNE